MTHQDTQKDKVDKVATYLSLSEAGYLIPTLRPASQPEWGTLIGRDTVLSIYAFYAFRCSFYDIRELTSAVLHYCSSLPGVRGPVWLRRRLKSPPALPGPCYRAGLACSLNLVLSL